MPSLPLDQVQDAIAKADYKWQARHTRVSELARHAGPSKLFGLSIGEPERRELMRAGIGESGRFSAVAPPPPKIDWRANGGNFVTSVKFQSTCNACVSFSTCATLESRALIKNNTPGLDTDLSEAHLFSCG